jgi:hypothetical protein
MSPDLLLLKLQNDPELGESPFRDDFLRFAYHIFLTAQKNGELEITAYGRLMGAKNHFDFITEKEKTWQPAPESSQKPNKRRKKSN